jgi:hypothetical protein
MRVDHLIGIGPNDVNVGSISADFNSRAHPPHDRHNVDAMAFIAADGHLIGIGSKHDRFAFTCPDSI